MEALGHDRWVVRFAKRQHLIERFHRSSLLLSILYLGPQQARTMGWCPSMLRRRSVW